MRLSRRSPSTKRPLHHRNWWPTAAPPHSEPCPASHPARPLARRTRGCPAAVFSGNVETSQYIVDALLGALGEFAASQGTMNNYIWGNDKVQNYETICGGSGASSNQPGCSAVHTHMTNSRLTDPEVLEWRFPVKLESFSIRKNSGGKGLNRGGDGVDRRMRFLEPMTVNIIAGHRKIPPYGVSGGESGAVGENYVIHSDESITKLGTKGQVEVGKNDLFVLKTPGGGGFGKAL